MITIIKGRFKGRGIDVPDKEVRPTSSLKKEAIFSILESYAINNNFDLYEGKCFIDLFAGSGSLGIESLSRGATFAYFYELNDTVINVLKNNCNKLCKKDEFKIFHQDSSYIKKFDINFPLSAIFIDPPYNYLLYNSILEKIMKSNIMNEDTIIIIETDKKNKFQFLEDFKIIKEKIYGKTKIFFFKKS